MDVEKQRWRWSLVVGFGLTGVGALLVCVGYVGVVGSGYDAERLSYLISGGVGGLFLMGVGFTLLVCADQATEGERLDRVEEAIRTGRWQRSAGESGGEAPLTRRPDNEDQQSLSVSLVSSDTGDEISARGLSI